MSSGSVFNQTHWSKKLPSYLAEEWSIRPSPFVQVVATYLKPNSVILELGTGAGQDGLWLASKGHTVTMTDGTTAIFGDIKKRQSQVKSNDIKLTRLDITKSFAFENNSFDCVYAQLVLHYFDDIVMNRIISEISRVLKPKGILACMMNSTKDSEYDPEKADDDGLINVDGLVKRFFSVESFRPFVKRFEPLLFDDQGRTPKDDAKNISGMIRYIGKKL